MELPLNRHAPPISKLDRDLLWEIFSINTDPDCYPNFTDVHLYPVTITLRSSQVCRFWRDILLASPSIWGNCLDLDRFGGNHAWKDEVLRRTGDALLHFKGSCSFGDPSNPPGFAFKIICEHWNRIKFLYICASDDFLADVAVQRALCQPAPHLQNFTLTAWRCMSDSDVISPPPRPPNSNLFGNYAPSLIHFCIGEHALPFSVVIPLPPALFSARLRRLHFHEPIDIAAPLLLDACAQMPFLNELYITIVRLVSEPGGPRHRSRPVSLPMLTLLWVDTYCWETYHEFITHLDAHPYKTDISTMLDPMPEHSETTATLHAREIYECLLRDMSCFFHMNSLDAKAGRVTGVKYMTIELSDSRISVSSNEKWEGLTSYCFEAMFDTRGTGTIPSAIRDAVINVLPSLDVAIPPTITLLQLLLSPNPATPWEYMPSLASFFAQLDSITELCATLDGLEYITGLQAKLDNNNSMVFFASVKTIILVDTVRAEHDAGWYQAQERLEAFFAGRRRTRACAVQIRLDLTGCLQPMGDLRGLDVVTGLKVVWKHADVSQEYICGSGSPEVLPMS